jgi:hypothetical protein
MHPTRIPTAPNPDIFHTAVDRIDAANALDPHTTVVAGIPVPHELHYARRMSRRLDMLEPTASEALRLAVRCQHLQRWMIPRSSYPLTRAGYHRWRSDLARFHADRAADILRGVGYDEGTIRRVQSLVRKEGLKTDPEAQTLEDVACLVFLEDEFGDFAARHDEEKVIHILVRTWGKMSPRGHAAALGLDLPADQRALIEKALARPPAPSPNSATPPAALEDH